MAEFTPDEWAKINALLKANPQKYGLPKREYGSVVLASFNIRKLGRKRQRNEATWQFLAKILGYFDLISIQEIMADLEGFDYLRELLGEGYGAVVSDVTGVFPGESGVGERLGFLYNRALVKRGNIVSDISYDRTKLLETLINDYPEISKSLTPYLKYLDELEAWKQAPSRSKPKPPNVQLPVFLTFIRQPFCTSFEISGHPGTASYKIMAVNAHLYFGDSLADRRQEFSALMEWLLARLKSNDETYFPNFILMGDLNLDFDNPERDRPEIEQYIKTFNQEMQRSGESANVNFPFIDVHRDQKQPFRTNARLSETFDQIALFSRDRRLPTYLDNPNMGTQTRGPDYGVFNFSDLFREALAVAPLETLSRTELKAFYARFEHEVSDHLPLWLRLSLPDSE